MQDNKNSSQPFSQRQIDGEEKDKFMDWVTDLGLWNYMEAICNSNGMVPILTIFYPTKNKSGLKEITLFVN